MFIGSSRATKALVFYITNYIIKVALHIATITSTIFAPIARLVLIQPSIAFGPHVWVMSETLTMYANKYL